MAFFRRNSRAAAPEPPATIEPAPSGKKDRPTPTRKEAEAARRQRLTTALSKKEARAAASRQSRAERMKAISAREAVPEKVLMRDYIDARFNIGEAYWKRGDTEQARINFQTVVDQYPKTTYAEEAEGKARLERMNRALGG